MRRRSLLSLIAPIAAHLSGCDRGPTPPQTVETAEKTRIAATGTTGMAIAGTADESSPSPSPLPAPPRPSRDEATAFATSANLVGYNLYRAAAKQRGNVALSPTSIALALGMAYGGATGETASQMKEALHFAGPPEDTGSLAGKLSAALQDPQNAVRLRIANRLFGQRGFPFRTAFLEATRRNFGAQLARMAFDSDAEGARREINRWVETQTEGHIRELIQSGGLGPDTRLLLVDAIYFKAEWSPTFPKKGTAKRAFRSPTGVHDVPTMHLSYFGASYAEPDGHQLLRLPYYGNTTSMLVALPRRGTALSDLEAQLSNEKLEGWVRSLTATDVSVALPKFKIEPTNPLSLRAALSELGMSRAFDESAAEFSGMVDTKETDKRLFLGDLVHTAAVIVDENGTEAAAASSTMIEVSAERPPPKLRFEANRPFLFFVRDDASGAVLFMGRVEDPAQV